MNLSEIINKEFAKGKTKKEIIKKLREQGYDEKTINDSFNLIKIKQAVNKEKKGDELKMEQNIPENKNEAYEQPQQNYETEGYDQEYNQPQQNYETEGYDQEYNQPQQNYETEGYDQGYATSSMDSGRMIEISEKVFDEKIQKIQDKINDLDEFKTLTKSKIDNFSQRINKIESTLDKLQVAILKKIGSYTDTLDDIKDEMHMMQDSFGKIVNQAVKGASKTKKGND